jgi:hypothetical protein
MIHKMHKNRNGYLAIWGPDDEAEALDTPKGRNGQKGQPVPDQITTKTPAQSAGVRIDPSDPFDPSDEVITWSGNKELAAGPYTKWASRSAGLRRVLMTSSRHTHAIVSDAWQGGSILV